ncbi:MAG: hypothetical protein NT166_02340 [Candidatus Aminicenantes bacterium]|nr:hypothetical protein [Candidatus Aminicenantes bacterium]
MKKKSFLILLFVVGVVLILCAQSYTQKMSAPQKLSELQKVSEPQEVSDTQKEKGSDPCNCKDPWQGIGTEVTYGPIRDTDQNLAVDWVKYCLDLNRDVIHWKRDIIAYKIKWINGSWSTWYFPGVNDFYKKPNEPCRRVWACFADHTFTYIYNQL